MGFDAAVVEFGGGFGEGAFGFLAGFQGGGFVNVVRSQSGVGQYRDDAGLHFQVAAGGVEDVLLAFFIAQAYRPGADAREQWRVAGQDAQFA